MPELKAECLKVLARSALAVVQRRFLSVNTSRRTTFPFFVADIITSSISDRNFDTFTEVYVTIVV